MAGGVVEVACDARAFLGRREAALTVGLPLGPQRALLQLGHALPALTDAVAEDPGAAPDESSEEERHDGKLVLADAGSGEVDGKHADDRGGGQPQPGSRLAEG